MAILYPESGRTYEGGTYDSVWGEGLDGVTLRGITINGGSQRQGILLKRSSRIILDRVTVLDCTIGIHAADDSSEWTIADCTVERTSDSAIILAGSEHWILNSDIRDAGLVAGGPTYGVHAVYAKCSRFTAVDTRIRGFRDNGFSIRGPGALIESCDVEGDRGHALAYFEQLPAGEVNVVRYSRLAVPDGVAVYLDPSSQEWRFELCQIFGKVDARTPAEWIYCAFSEQGTTTKKRKPKRRR